MRTDKNSKENIFSKIGFFFSNSAHSFLLKMGNIVGTGRNTKETWRKIRPISIYLISFLLVIAVFSVGISVTLHKVFGAVNKFDKMPILFNINSGASMSYVASSLKEKGLINTSLGIKLLADFTSVSSKIQSGEYVLDKSMSVQDILDTITKPVASAKIISVTIIEGMTLTDFADTLQATGVISSADEFIEECKNVKNYTEDFPFLTDLLSIDGLNQPMEGYLFPDTYQFYADTDVKDCVVKFLNRMNNIYSEEYQAQAKKMGMTMHQVLTLASLIEKEGRGDDFSKISAVFHNRLNKNMRLESDVTVQYALGVKRLVLTAEELKINSPYNTYVVDGLPLGPICCPSKQAIEAALYPDEDIVKGNYLYFTLTDPYTGEVAYSKTYEEHLKVKNKYKDLWAAYDKSQGKK